MRSNSFFKFTTLALLILNIGILAFFTLLRPKSGHPHHFERKRANEIMDLSDEQHTLFLDNAKIHIESLAQLDNEQRDYLRAYFGSIMNPSINADLLLDQAVSIEKEKIKETLIHFQEIKKIINPDQEVKFETFINGAIDRMLIVEKNKPLPKKD